MRELPKVYLYHPEVQNDQLVSAWWSDLMQTPEETQRLFLKPSISLLGFLKQFADPNGLLYCFDERGIWWAGWTEPAFGGAFLGCWVRPDKRHTVSALMAMAVAYTAIFAVYPVILGVTWQPKLLDLHRKLGYRISGECSELGIWFVTLSKERFYEEVLRKHTWAEKLIPSPAPH